MYKALIMTDHNNQLIIDGKLVVSKVIYDKGSIHGEEMFSVTFEEGSTREMS